MLHSVNPYDMDPTGPAPMVVQPPEEQNRSYCVDCGTNYANRRYERCTACYKASIPKCVDCGAVSEYGYPKCKRCHIAALHHCEGADCAKITRPGQSLCKDCYNASIPICIECNEQKASRGFDRCNDCFVASLPLCLDCNDATCMRDRDVCYHCHMAALPRCSECKEQPAGHGGPKCKDCYKAGRAYNKAMDEGEQRRCEGYGCGAMTTRRFCKECNELHKRYEIRR